MTSPCQSPRSAISSRTASSWVRQQVPTGTLVAYGHAGDGNLHFNISFPTGTPPASLAQQEPLIRRAIHDLVAAHGGSFSAEHGIGRLKVGELERYSSPVTLAMMREVKHALDPHGIMNPGKLLAVADPLRETLAASAAPVHRRD